MKDSIIAYHLASLPVIDDRLIDDDFPYEQIVSVGSITRWHLYLMVAPISQYLALASC